MKFDKRNPFAAWGHEQEVYTKDENPQEGMAVLAEGQEGFQNETVVDGAYNETATVPSYTGTTKEAFFTNNECMKPVELATKAYGNDTDLQREYPSNEQLNYYGIQADDLELYGEITITVNVAEGQDEYGTVSGSGEYRKNTTATLTATANTGYVFKKWNDDNTTNPRTVTVTADATYTASFEEAEPENFTITVNVAEGQNEYGTVSGSGEYKKNATATLTATPNAGYAFKEWNDDDTTNPRTVTVTADATYTASFEEAESGDQ